MLKPALLILFCSITICCQAQSPVIRITVLNETGKPMPGASVQLMRSDSSLIQSQGADRDGIAEFKGLRSDHYILRTSFTGYNVFYTDVPAVPFEKTIALSLSNAAMTGVTVTAKKPFVQFKPDKTVINVDAGITNAGATVMDVLEKSPGITIGRDGVIIMKGKPQVMVLIDGKPTQLSGADLQSYLQGINASQIDVIELIDNPGAKYDAAGNAGIINIRTKTSKQKGFNGSMSLSVGQGFFPKQNQSLNLNYRAGRFNFFVNYGIRGAKERMTIDALRKYFDRNGNDSLLLQQPNVTRTNFTAHTIKTGIDFFADKNTTLGLVFTGTFVDRKTGSYSTIDWMSPSRVVDSTIVTSGTRNMRFRRAGVNLNGRHSFSDNSELSADLDLVSFDIKGDQYFQTQLSGPATAIQATKGDIPSTLTIVTAKADYSKHFKDIVWEAGVKTAGTRTDNLAQYYFFDGTNWQDDLSRSNHFLYDENIHSVYSSLERDKGKWHWQAGLRYELTTYKANQLGNTVVKDSSFSRNYGSLFPSAFVSYKADSNNTFTFRFGRRIDRPPFQYLNPFLVTINKYTYESGNPFIRPQYTWNVELIHSFKQLLTTGISYGYLKDYFSQIFVIDSNSSNVNKNTIIYTRGNVGSFKNFGATMTVQTPLTKWWSITSTAVYNHKIIEGVVWKPIRAVVDQLNVSLSNQFQFKKGWSAELSGYYQTNSQIDLQEKLTPQGEVWAGISKQILKGKGSLRFTMRDIFHTQNYSGYSKFQNSDEPFAVKWDSQVARITFTWRFGQAMKAIRRSAGGATEETERVGNGN